MERERMTAEKLSADDKNLQGPFDYTNISARNGAYEKRVIEVAGGARFIVLHMTPAELARTKLLLYMHVNRETRKFYIGRSTMPAVNRFNRGNGYRLQKAMAAAIGHHGWDAFDTYVLALGDNDDSLSMLEVQAIKDAGGHKSHDNYNMSPGGEAVADNGKPVICVHMPTKTETEYESAHACGLALGIDSDGITAVARGDMNSRGTARRQNIGDYYFYYKGETPNYPDQWGKGARARRIAASQGRAVVAINYNNPSDIRRFQSMGEAARELGVHQSAVSGVARGKELSAGDWFFHFEDEPRELPKLRGSEAVWADRNVTVYAVNLTTGERTEHRNAMAAGQALGISPSSISTVLNRKRKSDSGYWFTSDPIAEPPKRFGKASVRFYKEQPIMAVERKTGMETPFPSAKAASIALGIHRSHICQVCAMVCAPLSASMGESSSAVLDSSLVVVLVPLQPYRSPRERPRRLNTSFCFRNRRRSCRFIR
jgi:hypothetical protein